MLYKCIIWGTGNDYEGIINQVQFEILKGNIELVALIARPQDIITKRLDNVDVVSKEKLIGGGV